MITKEKVEDSLGFQINDEIFSKAKSMAESKQRYLTKRFGDARGKRCEEAYLLELIKEAAVQKVFLDAMFTGMQDIKKGAQKSSPHKYTAIS